MKRMCRLVSVLFVCLLLLPSCSNNVDGIVFSPLETTKKEDRLLAMFEEGQSKQNLLFTYSIATNTTQEVWLFVQVIEYINGQKSAAPLEGAISSPTISEGMLLIRIDKETGGFYFSIGGDGATATFGDADVPPDPASPFNHPTGLAIVALDKEIEVEIDKPFAVACLLVDGGDGLTAHPVDNFLEDDTLFERYAAAKLVLFTVKTQLP